MSRSTILSLALVTISALSTFAASKPAGVSITEQGDKLRVEINGELFTEYHFRGAPHVYFYPLLGPGGREMTRNWPMKDVEGEEHDHKHHRSLWYAHGSVNGVDFWAEEAKSGSIQHEKFLKIKSGRDMGEIRSRNRWVALNGEVPLTDECVFRIYNRPANERLFDFEITLKAGAKDVVLGDTKEGCMAIRINEQMRLTHGKKPGDGRIALSTGILNDQTWGKAANWCDYSGPVQGKVVGIAIFDHPDNPFHPTTWHVRDYGLFAANPFGLHDFDKDHNPAGAGNATIPAGKKVTFRYRFYLHEGDEKQAAVAERYQTYASGSHYRKSPLKDIARAAVAPTQ